MSDIVSLVVQLQKLEDHLDKLHDMIAAEFAEDHPIAVLALLCCGRAYSLSTDSLNILQNGGSKND